MKHIELHHCETAGDAAHLVNGGLPRYDIEPSACDNCHARVGEVNGQNDVVFWRPLTVVVWADGLAVLCGRCVKPVINIVS